MGNTPKFLASIVAGVLIAFVAYQIGFQTACSKNNTLKESPDSNESLAQEDVLQAVVQSPTRMLTEQIFKIHLPDNLSEIRVVLFDCGSSDGSDNMEVKVTIPENELESCLQDKFKLLQTYDNLSIPVSFSATLANQDHHIVRYCVAFDVITDGKYETDRPCYYYVCEPIGKNVTIYINTTMAGWYSD